MDPPSAPQTSAPVSFLRRSWRGLTAGALALAGLLLWQSSGDWGLPGFLLRAYTLTFAILFALWLLALVLRRFLWRVSRRLAFSYFLFGIVPVVLGALLVMVLSYTLSGYFVGHIFRDTLGGIGADVRLEARRHLEQWRLSHLPESPEDAPIAVAYYRKGVKIAGDPEAPRTWQTWWPAEALDAGTGELDDISLVEGPDGRLTVMSAVFHGRWGVVARWRPELTQEVTRRSGLWVDLFRPDEVDRGMTDRITAFNREFALGHQRREVSAEELAAVLHPNIEEPGLLDRPSVRWMEIWSPFYLAQGEGEQSFVYADLVANLRGIYYRLLSSSAEVDSRVVLSLAVIAFVLFDIYILAALMAALMVAGLSRAVNRLTEATERMQAGDFGARIEVDRQDQIGALQDSFNDMARNLQSLVAEAAQKEVLEKDLAFARELQRSLLPDTLSAPSSMRFSTHFAPCSAIGGDYYDLLPMGDQKMAVMVADAAGHGITAGLRMAMVKSALQVLAAQQPDPLVILRQLHQLLRSGLAHRRSFVTATLGVLDGSNGELILTNAGHAPTYVLREGRVTAIELPSLPLGTFTDRFARRTFRLQPGDTVIWLSDGLIEATNARLEAFGFEAVEAALAGPADSPDEVRDRLLAAVDAHTGRFPADDDRTLLVMTFCPEWEAAEDVVEAVA